MFNISFSTMNSAFEEHDPDDVKRILVRIADLVRIGHSSGKILDTNGNQIGKWSWNETQFAKLEMEDMAFIQVSPKLSVIVERSHNIILETGSAHNESLQRTTITNAAKLIEALSWAENTVYELEQIERKNQNHVNVKTV